MRLNVLFREQNETFGGVQESNETIGVGFEGVQTKSVGDYNKLSNKPSINSVVLEGALTAADLGLGSVYYDTTANWNAQPNLESVAGTVYIYSDYTYIDDQSGNRTWIAGMKIGDGTSFVIDLPFVSDGMTYMLVTHMADQQVHITQAEREFWNNKVSAYIDRDDGEALVLSKSMFEQDGVLVAG